MFEGNHWPKVVLAIFIIILLYLAATSQYTDSGAETGLKLLSKSTPTSAANTQPAVTVAGPPGGCKHGVLLPNGKCRCVFGWKGEACEIFANQEGGAWTAEFHKASLEHDTALVPTILKVLKTKSDKPIRSVLDVGCGLGVYLKDFYNEGVKECVGVEPNNMAVGPESPFFTGECRQVEDDLFDEAKPEVDLGQKFDLVTSFEVAEHIPRDRHTRFFNFLTKHSNGLIVFSGAFVGQTGIGHVAERPFEEWVTEFTSRGWVLDWPSSQVLRNATHKPWFQLNLAVFYQKK